MNRGLRLFWTLAACLFCALLAAETASAAERSVIVGFRQAPGATEQALISGKKGRVNRKFKHLPAVTATLPEAEIAALRSNPNVAYVADNTPYAVETTLPGTEYDNSWNVDLIGAKAAHDAGIVGTGVKVAVLDAGIDPTHPELVGAYKGGIDIAGGDADPSDEPTSGHGTHVAGIIAGARNSTGIVGVAPGVSLYAVKIFVGVDNAIGTPEWLIAGIDWAIDNQMAIVNLSNGIGPDENPAVTAAIARAEAAGILVVAAVGNEPTLPVSHPAAIPSVIAVTAVDISRQIGSFAPTGSQIDLAAPGVDVTSTVKGGYKSMTGTSMAAPQVTGVAALLLSAGQVVDENGSGSRLDELKARLLESADDLGLRCKDNVFGYGLVNAARALGLAPDPAPVICSADPVDDLFLVRQSRQSAEDARTATLNGGKYAITILNNGLKAIQVVVSKENVFVPELSGTMNFYRKTPREVTLPFDASSGPYQVLFTPVGKFGSSATLLFNTPHTSLPEAVKGHNRKFKHLP
jgi:subtilisin